MVLIFCSSAMIIIFTYSRMSKSILEFSNSVMVKFCEVVIDRTDAVFSSAENEVEEASRLLINDEDFSINNSILTSYLLQVIKDNPNFYSVYYGKPDGSMLAAATLAQGRQTHYVYTPAKLLPPSSIYIVRFVDHSNSSAPSDTWYYRDQDFQPLDLESNPQPAFNVTTRPWYIGAVEAKGHIFWTPFYTFDLTGERGTTASQALYDANGELIGVIGVDITLSLFSHFLTEQKIEETGRAFVLNASGQVIIPQNIPSAGITKDVIAAAYKEAPKNKNTSFTFSSNDIRYVASINRFPVTKTFDWTILIIVPLSEFMSDLLKTQKDVVFISLGILLFACFLVVYFSKRISGPIVVLANETDKIRHLNFESEIRIRSNIREIKLMDHSIAAMRVAIRSFGRYIPKEIVMQLVEKGKEIAIGGEKRETTVLFSDIEGFTTIAETYDTEKLMVLLSEYFDGMSKILLKNQGNIDKFIGDGIMALWGAPRPLPLQAQHACTAALECQAHLAKLNQRLEKEGKPVLRTRIGIDTGETIVGNVGTAERMNYTAMGNTVNTAARLQNANKLYNTQILISERVQAKIGRDFLTRPLDIVELKGKKIKTKIYELANKADPDQVALCTQFTEAFNAFQAGDLAQAKALFLHISQQFPNDMATQIYLKKLS